MNGKQCMSCGAGSMEYRTGQSDTVRCREAFELVENLSGWYCLSCGDAVLDAQSSDRYTAAGDRVVLSARAYEAEAVRRIRKQLKLTQAELAEVFGVGKIAFSRYERGETTPPAPLVKLLKLLSNHPELLAEVRHV